MSRARDLANSADNDISGTLTVDDLTLSGNITVGGTVDGRDLATDGSKLDGVEANATADQTGAEIKAAYEGEADTNAYTDAEKTKLSGIETGATADQTKADIDALNINADTLDGQHGSYYTAYADTAVANLVDSAPGTLDTLNELAAALGDDPNFATTVTNSIATKMPLAGGTFTGGVTGTTATFSGNLLVGKTTLEYENTAGHIFRSDGLQSSIRDGGNAADFNRLSSDGEIIRVSKDGTTVGSIASVVGTRASFRSANTVGYLGVGSTDYYGFKSTAFVPTTSGVYDLGGTGEKFRNGYFSGAVYGNTFSAVSYVDTPDIYLGGNLYHNGDTNTYLSFPSVDNIAIATGGTNRIYVDNAGVRIGDTGNGYIRPVSGSYGSTEIHGGSHGGWEGYSISGRAVFMHNNSNDTGLYDDVNNNWLFLATHGGAARMAYNGSTKLETTSGGAAVTGALTATGNITAYYSDERLKTKTGDLDGALEKIKQLNGFYYVENDLAKELGFDNDEQQVALSAQEVQAVMPEAVSLAPFDMAKDEETGDTLNVSASGEDYLTVDYARLVPLLVEAIKELKAEIEELKNGSTN